MSQDLVGCGLKIIYLAKLIWDKFLLQVVTVQ